MAHSYRTVHSTFWTGDTGRQIRKAGAEVQLLALYVLTSPHSNMIGLYHLPLAYIAADTGLSPTAVRDGLEALSVAQFVVYDSDAECIWVREAVTYQASYGSDKTKDKRLSGAVTQWKAAGSKALKAQFRTRYETLLPFPEGASSVRATQGQDADKPPASPLQAPSEPLPRRDIDRYVDRDIDKKAADAASVWAIWREEVERHLADVPSLHPRENEKANCLTVVEKRRSNAWVRRVLVAFLTSTNKDVDAKPRTLGHCLYWWSKIEHGLASKGYVPDEVAA